MRLPRLLACLATVAMAGAGAAEQTVEAGSPLSRTPVSERTATIQQRWAASVAVAWPGARASLADAVAALNASGNPTTLADGVDGARVVDLPDPGDGDYWQALSALCEAAELEPLPGRPVGIDGSSRQVVPDASAVAITAGPMVLGPASKTRPRPLRACRGPVLVEAATVAVHRRQGVDAKHWIDLGVRLRLEPRLDADAIGDCRIAWSLDGGGTLREDAATGRADLTRIVIDDPPERLGQLRFVGTLTVGVIEPLTLDLTMRPGDRATIAAAGSELNLRLLDAEQAKTEGKQSSGALLDYDGEALAREPALTVSVGGKPLPTRGGSSHSGGKRNERMMYLNDLADADHVVHLESALSLASLTFPVGLAVDLAALPADERAPAAPLDRATPVAWPAGERSLAEAVQLLNVGGNQVVLELGVADSRRAQLPAFSGGFWDGVLAVRAAFPGLDPIPAGDEEAAAATAMTGNRRVVMRRQMWRMRVASGNAATTTPLDCGPLRLGHGDGTGGGQVCGPVVVRSTRVALTATRGLDGVSRALEAAVRLRLEPRFARDLLAQATVTWATQGEDQDGRPVGVRDAAEERDDGDGEAAGAMRVAVAGLDPRARQVSAHGLLRLVLRRAVRQELSMTVGESRVVVVGESPLTVTLLGAGIGDGRAGIRVAGAGDAVEDLDVVVREADGKAKQANNRSSSRFNGASAEQTWYFDQLGDGAHRVTVAGSQVIAEPCLPFTVAIDVPESAAP